MSALADWIGRSRSQEDEVTRPALRRIAAMLDRPDDFATGAPIPGHWYAMFFPEIAPQSQLGPDGHPRRGDFLPPVALPRRMFAGRRVRFSGGLRVGDVATKQSEITAITPRQGRSGAMVFVTIRHTISVAGQVRVIEDQDLVYREAAGPGAPAPVLAPVLAPAPDHADWQAPTAPDPTLLFRYSAVTWNGHRIHYDQAYTTGAEGYPTLVINGGLTLLLLLEQAVAQLGRAIVGLEVRNIRPLFIGQTLTLAGTDIRGDSAQAWVLAQDGGCAVTANLVLDTN